MNIKNTKKYEKCNQKIKIMFIQINFDTKEGVGNLESEKDEQNIFNRCLQL